MKKSFLHICLSESWGGLEMAVSRWNEVLKERGHDNLNICTPGSPLAQDLKQRALPLYEWDSAHYFAPDFTYKLHRLLKEKDIDVVILQNLRDLWIVSPALFRKPDIQLVGFAQMLLNIKKTDPLHRLVYNRLDHLLTLTDWQVQRLLPCLPVPPYKYKTIPNFVDTKHFHPSKRSNNLRHQLGYGPEDFVIGVIGRIDVQKGQKEMLEAFKGICGSFERSQLLIVGEPTLGETAQETYYSKLKDYVSENNLSKRVRFLGFQKDTQKLTASLDLFVLPSHEETFGYVVVEAMASGTPVMGTAAGGVPEILQQGDCGTLFAPKDTPSLARKLKEVLTHKEERIKKAQKALYRAQDFYDRGEVCRRFLDIVNSFSRDDKA